MEFSFYKDLPLGQVAVYYFNDPTDHAEAKGKMFPEVARKIEVAAHAYAQSLNQKFDIKTSPCLERVMVMRLQ